MKRRQQPSDDARLSALLQAWQVEKTAPPRFAQAVWRRLEDGKPAARTQSPDKPRWIDWLIDLLGQPRFALACLAAFLVAGAGTGTWQGREGSAALSESLRGLYVQSIDPFATARR